MCESTQLHWPSWYREIVVEKILYTLQVDTECEKKTALDLLLLTSDMVKQIHSYK